MRTARALAAKSQPGARRKAKAEHPGPKPARLGSPLRATAERMKAEADKLAQKEASPRRPAARVSAAPARAVRRPTRGAPHSRAPAHRVKHREVRPGRTMAGEQRGLWCSR